MVFPFIEASFVRRVFYKIEGLFRSPEKLPPDAEREEIEFPAEANGISVELALNSRCTSDYDGNPKKFHWGMFDRTKKLSAHQIQKIIYFAKVPRFTDQRIEIQSNRNMLTFVIDNSSLGVQRDWLMVESGMQQQAICLVCAAFGAGMVFKSLSDDGAVISAADYATIKVKLDAMKPTYNGSFWSNSPPSRVKPWLQGNLREPVRDGNKPLTSTLQRLKIEKRSGRKSTDESVGQLVWAARGRTPHFFKSRPWGMTVPTSRGEQHISNLYLISDYKLSRYVNWHENRPTHSLELLAEIDSGLYNEPFKSALSHSYFIILGKNENSGRAFWEIGYQLLNLLLQAQALDLVYEAVLLDEKQQKAFRSSGIKDPVCAFLLQ